MSTVYLNGAFVAREKASVSVLDRGFLLGDGVYEVIPAYRGKLFLLEAHLNRLQASLDEIAIGNPMSNEQWSAMLNELVAQNGSGDLSVYLQVTRGAAERDHAFPENTPPTIFAMANPIQPTDPQLYENGVSAHVMDDNRWIRCNIKSISLLPNVLLRQSAIEQGFAEAILVRDGMVTEGAASNVFAIIDGTVYTAPPGPYLLTGITRDLVVELLSQGHIPFKHQSFSRDQLLAAEEVWVTSSTKEVVPVTSLDGQPVGTGKPGAVWKQVSELYKEYKESLV